MSKNDTKLILDNKRGSVKKKITDFIIFLSGKALKNFLMHRLIHIKYHIKFYPHKVGNLWIYQVNYKLFIKQDNNKHPYLMNF